MLKSTYPRMCKSKRPDRPHRHTMLPYLKSCLKEWLGHRWCQSQISSPFMWTRFPSWTKTSKQTRRLLLRKTVTHWTGTACEMPTTTTIRSCSTRNERSFSKRAIMCLECHYQKKWSQRSLAKTQEMMLSHWSERDDWPKVKVLFHDAWLFSLYFTLIYTNNGIIIYFSVIVVASR